MLVGGRGNKEVTNIECCVRAIRDRPKFAISVLTRTAS